MVHVEEGLVEIDPSAANERARNLLISYLDPEQRDDFERVTAFIVESRTGMVFWVHPFRVCRIESRKSGMVLMSYCIAAEGRQNIYDTMLAIKLMLEADLMRFFMIANPILNSSGFCVFTPRG